MSEVILTAKTLLNECNVSDMMNSLMGEVTECIGSAGILSITC